MEVAGLATAVVGTGAGIGSSVHSQVANSSRAQETVDKYHGNKYWKSDKRGMMFNRSNSQMFWGGVFDGITLGLGRLKSSLQRMYIYDEDYDEIDDALVRKIE